MNDEQSRIPYTISAILRIRLMTCRKPHWFLLIFVLASAAMRAQQPPASDPLDLQMQFRSATGSNRFRVGEVIPIEILISSTSPDRYLEPCTLFSEINFGYRQCRFFSQWSLAIRPETGWVDYTKEFTGPATRGGPTFSAPNNTLTSQSQTFPYYLTNRFRFDRPGQYKVSFTLQVGLNDASNQVRQPLYDPQERAKHSVSITRDMLLEIVPAEEEWQ